MISLSLRSVTYFIKPAFAIADVCHFTQYYEQVVEGS
jgi:hypothetical protein